MSYNYYKNRPKCKQGAYKWNRDNESAYILLYGIESVKQHKTEFLRDKNERFIRIFDVQEATIVI